MSLARIVTGDCREVLRDFAAEGLRARCCVTSPPYWGLRDYGVDGQIGLEETPQKFVDEMVGVFRLVREVLADDGVLWLNLGDSYATGAGTVGDCPGGGKQGARWRGEVTRARDDKRGYRGDRLVNTNSGDVARPKTAAVGPMTQPNRMPIAGLKAKDLVGIPWRVAFALQADGWWLRQDVIWAKPNPMPESVRDRCTKSHEYLFLLAKSERYFFDSDAIAELATGGKPGNREPYQVPGQRGGENSNLGGSLHKVGAREQRNRRSVWSIATEPFRGAHFATFPQELARLCVLSGSKPGDLVLDPFMGSGTVARVAIELGRVPIGCDLNPDYERIQKRRTERVQQLLTPAVDGGTA